MTEILQNLHFIRPQFLWFLIPALFSAFLLFRKNSQSGNWKSVISPELLPHLLISPKKEAKKKSSIPLLILIWILSSLAMAGPTWKKLPRPVLQKEDAIVILLDLSASMLASDIAPSRAERAKQKLLDLLSLRKEGVTALVAYAGDAHVVTPLTDDTETIANLLPALSPNMMPFQGSATGSAIAIAQELLTSVNSASGKILLLSDGVSERELQASLKLLSDNPITISVLGIGTGDGAPIPLPAGGFLKDKSGAIVIPRLVSRNMEKLASSSGGQYSPLTLDDSDVLKISKSDVLQNDSVLALDRSADTWEDQGHWLILLILPFALVSFRRGLLIFFPFLFLFNSETSIASVFNNLWLTPDQHAAKALRENDPAKAAQLFENKEWAGTASYRAEEYANAAKFFSDNDTADSWYNRGNALAKSGNYSEAIEAYEKSLEIEPGATDALENIELLKKLQEQEKNSKENQQSNQNNNQNANNSEENNTQQNKERTETSNHSQDSKSTESQKNDTTNPKDSIKDNKSNPLDEKEIPDKKQSNSDSEQLSQTEHQRDLGQQESEKEKDQSTEQWLRRIPDDPSGLLREKFRYESMQRQRNREKSESSESW